MQVLGLQLSHLPSLFGAWWCNEAQALLPRKTWDWLNGSKRSAVVIGLADTFIEMEVVGDEREVLASDRTPIDAFSMPTLVRFLHAQGLDLSTAEIGIRVRSEQIFCRTILLPVQAKQQIDQITLRDLSAKTPFQLKDIYCGQSAHPSNEAKTITVYQWIVLRRILQDIAITLNIRLEDLSYVEGPPQPNGLIPHVSLRSDKNRKVSWFSLIVRSTVVSALTLAVVTSGAEYWRQQSTLDTLDIKIAAARSHAQRVQAAIRQLEEHQSIVLQVRKRKTSTPGFLDVWEEISRALPSHSWLTELRLSQAESDRTQQVSMVGFSSGASTLVGIINESPRFTETQLTAPVTMDSAQERERFSLQAKLRSPEPTALVKP